MNDIWCFFAPLPLPVNAGTKLGVIAHGGAVGDGDGLGDGEGDGVGTTTLVSPLTAAVALVLSFVLFPNIAPVNGVRNVNGSVTVTLTTSPPVLAAATEHATLAPDESAHALATVIGC